MKPLRAFLFAKGSGEDWASTPFRELEPLIDAARLALRLDGESAAIHIGFWRPETERIAELARQWPGKILLSQAVIGALPPPARSSDSHVGDVDGLRFHLALEGFGYEMEDPNPHQGLKRRPISNPLNNTEGYVPRGWVEQLLLKKPELEESLEAAGIWDEESYHDGEINLEFKPRLDLALHRYHLLVGAAPSSNTILQTLHACPRWLLGDELHNLDLTVRMRNVVVSHKFTTIADLHKTGYAGLFKLPNLGRGSIEGLGVLIWRCFQFGDPLRRQQKNISPDTYWPLVQDQSTPNLPPIEKAQESEAAAVKDLTDGFAEATQLLKPNERGILAARLGYQCVPQTLHQIAEQIGLTRERVRQIEVSIYKKIRHHRFWRELADRLTQHLDGRKTPLLFHGISAIDPWFRGIEDLRHPVQEVFDHLLQNRFAVIDVGETAVITYVTQNEWNDAIAAGKVLLREMVPQRVNEDFARFQVEALLSDKGEALRGDLWSLVRSFALWAKRPDEPALLTGYGHTAEAVVVAVLEESGHALHFSEIHRRATLISQKPHEKRRLHHAARVVAVLYRRGTYGLLSQCPLSERDLALIAAEVEDICSGSDSERQWHTSELLDELLERGLDFNGQLTKYIINIALRDSETFAYMKRMVWGYREHWTDSAASRLDMRQAVMALLEEAGRPLSTLEVREGLRIGRGVNAHFQIHPTGNLIRMGSGLWGLADRDVNIPNPDELLDRLVMNLEKTQQGVHVSEVGKLLGGLKDEDTHALIGLIKRKGMRTDRGQYVHLAGWEGSRRVWPTDAVEQAIDAFPQGASIEQIRIEVNRLTRRDIDPIYISQLLSHIEDVSYSTETELWGRDVSIEDVDTEDEEEDATSVG